MEKNPTATQKNTLRRIAAGLIVLAGIPVLILLTELWCRLCIWLLSLIEPHLSGFWADLFDDAASELGISAIATVIIMYLSGSWFAERAEKLIDSRRGWRYFIAAACSFVLAGLCSYWLLRARLPFRLPFEPNPNVMINLILALGIYGVSMIRAVFAMREERKKLTKPPEHIMVFCHTKQEPSSSGTNPPPNPKEKINPFCYITGGPALVNNRGSLAVPERRDKLDLAYFNRIKDYIYREERVRDQQNWGAVYVFDGYIVKDKAICADLLQVFPDKEQWNYANLLISPLFDKQPAGFLLGNQKDEIGGDLKYSRHYRMDARENVTPAFLTKTPRQKWEALQAEQAAPAKHLRETQNTRTVLLNSAPKPAAAPTAPAQKRAPLKTETKAAVPPTKSAPKPAAAPASKAKPTQQLRSINDIRDGKRSDNAPSALADAAKQTPKQVPKQEQRKPSGTAKKLIHIVLDSSLTEAERDLVVQATEHGREVFPDCSLELTGQGRSAAAESLRKRMDACLEGTRRESGQYDASLILRKMENLAQYKKEAAATLLFTGRDLCLSSQGASWCFGAGNRDRRTAVCSLYRYRELTAPERLRCTRRTLRHEIGHALGLAADPKRANTETHFGPHCTVPGCSMRQTENLLKLLRYSREEEQQGRWFCPDCLADLERALSQTK